MTTEHRSTGAKNGAPAHHRDHALEHQLLTSAAGAHNAPFVAHVTARLEAGEERFGSSWAWIGIRRHIAELLEEAADLGAWGVLAHQALDHEHVLTEAQHEHARRVLAVVVADGARAHHALAELRQQLQELG